jgi:hypothetical protein
LWEEIFDEDDVEVLIYICWSEVLKLIGGSMMFFYIPQNGLFWGNFYYKKWIPVPQNENSSKQAILRNFFYFEEFLKTSSVFGEFFFFEEFLKMIFLKTGCFEDYKKWFPRFFKKKSSKWPVLRKRNFFFGDCKKRYK